VGIRTEAQSIVTTTGKKATTRETLSLFRDQGLRSIIVELHSTYMVLRLKGKRYRYTVTYEQAWKLGARNAAEETRRSRLESKAARQQERRTQA
jgi:hypothetical protein